jgi:hypothetical protein
MKDWMELDREPLKASISLPLLNLLPRGENRALMGRL